MPIRLLPPDLVNRIAAGEVVERPAAAVKELVENAIDAGSRQIEVTLGAGGQALIAVVDDGIGMGKDEMELAVERHATSKLPDDDLLRIATLGFRGEALPAIGSVARLAITSRPRNPGPRDPGPRDPGPRDPGPRDPGMSGEDTAWRLLVEGGRKMAPEPAAQGFGTRVEVRDLFFATPARLKFMKSQRGESGAARDVLERLAMAHPEIGFTLIDDGRSVLRLPALPGDSRAARKERLGALIGRDFARNSVAIDAGRGGLVLTGHAGLPTFNKATAAYQYLFVNGRPVRDKLLTGAMRAGYQDLLARDRHPVVALFLDLPAEEVDVNVHPAKAEVRFRDPGLVRGLIVSALRHALAEAGHRNAASVSGLGALGTSTGPGSAPTFPPRFSAPPPSQSSLRFAAAGQAPFADRAGTAFSSPPGLGEDGQAPYDAPPASVTTAHEADGQADLYPLGLARAQLHATYVVAETGQGLVIVDQHAAHERLTFERIQEALTTGGAVARQGLLIPEVVELDEAACGRLLARAEDFAALGLVLESFGPGAVVVREIPALLGDTDVVGLVRDLADELAEWDGATALTERLSAICARMACHGSIRAGRKLSTAEMDALLRQIEATPRAGQCPHGRPTYIELKLADIEKLFGRR